LGITVSLAARSADRDLQIASTAAARDLDRLSSRSTISRDLRHRQDLRQEIAPPGLRITISTANASQFERSVPADAEFSVLI
jgi:hypothetical protein